jgi:serine phosphatase RsbU (regulator of sigma subunit)
MKDTIKPDVLKSLWQDSQVGGMESGNRTLSKVDILNYFKLFFERISISYDIESTLYIIMDMINDSIAPETSFILTAGGETLLENSLDPFSEQYVQRLEREGVLDWVRDHGQQSVLTLEEQKIAVAPLSVESTFQGHLILVLNHVEITPGLLDLIYISSQIVSVFFSKMQMSRALIEKSHRLEMKISETKKLFDELLVLHEFVSETGAIIQEEDLFQKLIDLCIRALGMHHGYVISGNRSRSHLVVAASNRAEHLGLIIPNSGSSGTGSVDLRELELDDLARRFGLDSPVTAPVYLEGSLYALVLLSGPPLGRTFTESDDRILWSLARQAGQCLQNIKLHEQLVEKKTMERDLELARSIQLSLLPGNPPDIQGLDMKAFFKPARQVGGDFYDLNQLGGHRVWFCLGDVAGKGMAAAIIMATLRSMLKAELRSSFTSPGRLLTSLNSLLCPDTREGRFVTFFTGFIDTREERVVFSNAGHPPLMLYREREDRVESYQALTMPLGIAEGTTYPTQDIPFQSGDILLLYTDGVHEAMNLSKEDFGLERLEMVFHKAHHASPEKIVQAILTSIRDFTGELPQYDDITLMVIKRH